MEKRTLTIIFAVVLVLLSCSVNVMAADNLKEYPFNICYDENTCRLYNKDGRGLLFGFDYDTDDNYWYTPINAWQRNLGYSKIYDNAAFLIGCYYDTIRVTFEYNNKEWLIQYWKGIYGFTSGAEIGIYNRPVDSRGSFYNAVTDDELPKMSLIVKSEDKVFLSQPNQRHWWLTGFVLPSRKNADELYCEMSVDMENEDFSRSLIEGLIANGFVFGESIITSGTCVTLLW